MKINHSQLALIVISCIGLFLRVICLDRFPPGISWDEISHGYNAYSILKTGFDEWGKFPLSNFRAYGDYPLALNLYLTIPFIAVFGLNEFSIRLPHALLGVLTIVASYFLSLGLTKNKNISLLTAFLVAIEPWHLFFSRFVAQSNLAVFFLTASAAAFFHREKNKYLLPLSLAFLGLSVYSYHTTRIFSPILFLVAVLIFRKDLMKNYFKKSTVRKLTLLVLITFFLPLPYLLLQPESRARSSEVFLIDQGVVNKIIEKRFSSHYPDTIKKIIYNRPLYFIREASLNHIEYFLPKFLFFKGGTHYQFSIPERGLLYLVNLPFYYFGIYLVIRKILQKNKNYLFILLWFILAPLPGSITKEHLAVMRDTTVLPLPQFFSALGFFGLLQTVRDKEKIFRLSSIIVVWFFYLSFLLINMRNYLNDYFGNYTKNYSQDRQYGYKQVVRYIKENYRSYDKIILTKKYGEPHEFILFFWPWNPINYKNDPNLIRFYQSNWYWVDRFDKFYFVNDWDIPKEEKEDFILESGGKFDCQKSNCLVITSPGNYPKGWKKLKTIYFLNNKVAFEILENNYPYDN